MTLEVLASVLLSAALIVPITALAAATLKGGMMATLVPGACAAIPLWLGAFAGAWLGVATIKEHHLFHYFKTR